MTDVADSDTTAGRVVQQESFARHIHNTTNVDTNATLTSVPTTADTIVRLLTAEECTRSCGGA
jgi:hypothetical protein